MSKGLEFEKYWNRIRYLKYSRYLSLWVITLFPAYILLAFFQNLVVTSIFLFYILSFFFIQYKISRGNRTLREYPKALSYPFAKLEKILLACLKGSDEEAFREDVIKILKEYSNVISEISGRVDAYIDPTESQTLEQLRDKTHDLAVYLNEKGVHYKNYHPVFSSLTTALYNRDLKEIKNQLDSISTPKKKKVDKKIEWVLKFLRSHTKANYIIRGLLSFTAPFIALIVVLILTLILIEFARFLGYTLDFGAALGTSVALIILFYGISKKIWRADFFRLTRG